MKESEQIVENILAEHIRPKLSGHGGNITLLEIRDGIAYVKFTGQCSGCPGAKYTLESLVKEEVLKYTDLVEDVRLQEEVSQELYDFAKQILSRKENG